MSCSRTQNSDSGDSQTSNPSIPSLMLYQLSQVHCIYWITGLKFQKKIVFLSLKIDCVLANSANHVGMPHHEAFHLSLSCLQKYLIRGFLSTKVNSTFFFFGGGGGGGGGGMVK